MSRVRYQSGSLPVGMLRNILRTMNGINPKDKHEITLRVASRRRRLGAGAAAFLVVFIAFAAIAGGKSKKMATDVSDLRQDGYGRLRLVA